MSGCGAFSLVGTEGQKAGVYPLRCGSWRCPGCGPRRRKEAVARIRRGLRLGQARLLTVTSPAGDDRDTSFAELQERWRRLLRLVEQRFGKIEFVAVVETQARGAAHLHVVYRGPFIAQPWLSVAAQAAGFGPIADVRRVRGDVATYVTKSLTAELTDKSAAPPAFFRRVRWSRH